MTFYSNMPGKGLLGRTPSPEEQRRTTERKQNIPGALCTILYMTENKFGKLILITCPYLPRFLTSFYDVRLQDERIFGYIYVFIPVHISLGLTPMSVS